MLPKGLWSDRVPVREVVFAPTVSRSWTVQRPHWDVQYLLSFCFLLGAMFATRGSLPQLSPVILLLIAQTCGFLFLETRPASSSLNPRRSH